jgi:hypothetical protein
LLPVALVAAVVLGRRDERVLVDHLGQGLRLRLGVEQPAPANRGVDGCERIGVRVARPGERINGLVEQPHQPPDIARSRLITPLRALVGLGEQRADQLVEHLDGGVRQPRFEIDGLRGQRGAAAAEAIVAEQEGRRDGAFSHQLPKPVVVDAVSKFGIESYFADISQPLDDLVEVAGARRLRHVTEPGQRRPLQGGIVDQQRIEPGNLLGRQRCDQCVGGQFTGSRPTGQTDPLERVGARQHDPGGTNAVHHGADDHRSLVGGCGRVGRVPHHQRQIATAR